MAAEKKVDWIDNFDSFMRFGTNDLAQKFD